MADAPVIMSCGHAANAISNGNPACVICFTFDVMPEEVSTAGRRMRCDYNKGSGCQGRNGSRCCKPGTVLNNSDGVPVTVDSEGCWPSNPKVAFFGFKLNPGNDKVIDSFYCGCWGWD